MRSQRLQAHRPQRARLEPCARVLRTPGLSLDPQLAALPPQRRGSHEARGRLADLFLAPMRNDLVAAGSLRLIEGSIGQLQQFLRMNDLSLPRRYAEADRYG